MTWSLSLLLLAGVPTGGTDAEQLSHFDNYTLAYRTAQQVGRPMLVILNPAEGSTAKPISLEDVRRTKQRRELLNDYVVVVIDTETEHGKRVHKLFGMQQLPYVAVIDKHQDFQIYRTSEPLYGELWTQILTAFRTGERSAALRTAQYCYR